MAFGYLSRSGLLGLGALVLAAAGCGSGVSTAGLSPEAAQGAKYASKNCLGCHSVTGADGQGPTWKGLAGSQVKLTNGQTVTADDAYLTRAIENADAEIVSGYHQGVMTAAFPDGTVKPEQAQQLVAYIDALK